MIMKSEINKLICLLFVHLSSIIPENFKDLAFIIPEILEFIELHSYKLGLVYLYLCCWFFCVCFLLLLSL